MNDILTILSDNIDRVDKGAPLHLAHVSGSTTKHRKTKRRGDLCSLCSFGTHQDQPVDATPAFQVISKTAGRAEVQGNDPTKLFAFLNDFRARYERDGFTEITLHTEFVHHRFHAIPVPGGSVRVGGYGAGATDIFVDVGVYELAVQVDRLPRCVRFEVQCVSACEAGLVRGLTPSFPARKAISSTLPSIAVSDWVRFEDANRLETHFDRKGCYMVGQFNAVPTTESFPEAGLIYVGITTARTLRIRLKEFVKSATTHASGHSGGCEFRRMCIPDSSKRFLDWPMPKNTFVRLISVECSNSKAYSAVIPDLENRLITAYTDKYDYLPLCNRQG